MKFKIIWEAAEVHNQVSENNFQTSESKGSIYVVKSSKMRILRP